jgi:hypothetical protein
VNPLTKVYWIRVSLGAIAGLISTSVSILAQSATTGTSIVAQVSNTSTLLNGITIALLIYLLSFYALRAKFASQVEKKSKILSMGIFIYFFTWLVFWILTLTIYIGPV